MEYNGATVANLSLRLDAATLRAIEGLASATGRSKSTVVRDALRAYVDLAGPVRPRDVARDLIGIIDTRGAELSSRTGDKFAKALKDRRAQRPR